MPEKNLGVWGEAPIINTASQTRYNREKVQRLATPISGQALDFLKRCCITNFMLMKIGKIMHVLFNLRKTF